MQLLTPASQPAQSTLRATAASARADGPSARARKANVVIPELTVWGPPMHKTTWPLLSPRTLYIVYLLAPSPCNTLSVALRNRQ